MGDHKMNVHYFKAVPKTDGNKEYLFPTFRICRIAAGEFDWLIGEKLYSLKSGDIILLNNMRSRKILNCSKDPPIIDIFEFSPADIQNRNILLSMFYNEPMIQLTVENQRIANQLLSIITDSYETLKKPLVFDHILQAVFEILEDSSCDKIQKKSNSSLALEAVNYIWNHYFEDLSVDSVAKQLNVSKSNLEKQFKAMHGIGIGAYIRRIRVYNVTARLNESPQQSVLNVALSCGFKSSSGFYKAYKNITKRSPRR